MKKIKTFQDLLQVGENERERMNFALAAVKEWESGETVRTAKTAAAYFAGENTTIMHYSRIVYNLAGQARKDLWSPNHKIACHYYPYFVTQQVLFLLGNGISFKEKTTSEKLGRNFDRQIINAAIEALNAGECWLFWDAGRVEVFPVYDGLRNAVFAPLYDEETGEARAAVRKWQLDSRKPLRLTLFEEDGYTQYIQRQGEEMTVYEEKRPYKLFVRVSEAMGETIEGGENYPRLPIVPLYNFGQRSALTGRQQEIDALDLMMSGLVNNIDEAALIYWIIRNAGGMDDADDQRFVERLKTLHVVHLEGDEEVDAHTISVPFDASDAAIEKLKSQLFDSFMAFDPKTLVSGAATATQIKAAYEPLNSKTDLFEGCVTDCIEKILYLAGIDDVPTYTRSLLVNRQEEAQTLLQGANYLSSEYVTRKLLEINGDTDKADIVLAQIDADSAGRMALMSVAEDEA